MENEGLIRRSHGGAVLFESSGDEASARVREQQNRREKKIIGELGAGLVVPSSSIFIDSSSTAGAMIPGLAGIAGLTVITNGLRNALLLAEDPTSGWSSPVGRFGRTPVPSTGRTPSPTSPGCTPTTASSPAAA